MIDDTKPTPEPGEAQRGDDEIHYYEVDETNVGDSESPESGEADDGEKPGAAATE